MDNSWATFVTVGGGCLTAIVAAVVGAMTKLWNEVKASHKQHLDCEANRLADRLQHWRELEEIRKAVGLESKPPPSKKDTQVATAPEGTDDDGI